MAATVFSYKQAPRDMGFQPMQASSQIAEVAPIQKSKLAARGIRTLKSDDRCSIGRRFCAALLAGPRENKHVPKVQVALHGLEAHVTETCLRITDVARGRVGRAVFLKQDNRHG
jgi:hypothetical protein